MTQPVTILLIAVELACSLDLREKKGNKVNLVVKKLFWKNDSVNYEHYDLKEKYFTDQKLTFFTVFTEFNCIQVRLK